MSERLFPFESCLLGDEPKAVEKKKEITLTVSVDTGDFITCIERICKATLGSEGRASWARTRLLALGDNVAVFVRGSVCVSPARVMFALLPSYELMQLAMEAELDRAEFGADVSECQRTQATMVIDGGDS